MTINETSKYDTTHVWKNPLLSGTPSPMPGPAGRAQGEHNRTRARAAALPVRQDRDYDAVHPDYSAKRLKRYRDIYNGLARPEVIREYLFRNDSESAESYEARLRRAAYINLAAPVADLFAAVASGSVNRSGLAGIPALEDMLHNCDRAGASPEIFFKRVCGAASPYGAHFVLVDMPRADAEASSLTEAAAMGLTPYFVSIPAQNLCAWDFDETGALSYVVLRGTRRVSSGPFTSFKEVATREVWTKTGWQRLEATDDSTGGGEFIVVAEGTHPCGAVPVVPFLFEEETPMTGLSVFDDVAENIVQLFNCWSEYDKSLADASLPWLMLSGINPEEALSMVRSSDSAIATANPEAGGKYLETSGTSFAAKVAEIEAAVRYITNVSLRRTRPDSASAVSAESKREDNRELVALMKDFAASMRESERRCWQLAGKWLGLSDETLRGMHVAYEVKYDVDEISEGTIATLIDLVQSGIFSAQTVRGMVWRTHFIQGRLTPEEMREGFDAEAERVRITAEKE